MPCAEALQTEAYFDAELEPAAAAAAAQHAAECAECRKLLEELKDMRTTLRAALPPQPLPASLRTRLLRAVDALEERGSAPARADGATAPPQPFWVGLLSGIGVSAVAAAAGFLLVAPLFNNRLVTELTANHSRSLATQHLIDVVSTDHHTVKPWFAGRTAGSPVVADFASEGYQLLGGRVAPVAGQNAAVVVYQHGAHYIDVFSWPAGRSGAPSDTTRNGYHIACWQGGDLAYCAVSDTGWNELLALVGLLQDEAARDAAH